MTLSAAQCRAARALLDWTQAELARRADISPGTVRGFEVGRHALHRATAAAICRAFEAEGLVLLDPGRDGGEGVRRAPAPGCPHAPPPL